MKVTFTEKAEAQLAPILGDGAAWLRLAYDTEGCGCSVNGVPAIWLVSEPFEGDFSVEAEPFRMVVNAKDEIFFEEQMKIDFLPEKKSYILKSNGQIYNAGMSLVDKR